MSYLFLFVLCALYHPTISSHDQLPLEPGSCSRKCGNIVTEQGNETKQPEASLAFPCSCSLSCLFYKDCCYDSTFRNQDVMIKTSSSMCISVSGRGYYRVINKCPRDWTEPSHFCTESIGYLPPVTSLTSGISYANIYCAICHNDGEDLKIWDVELRCCSEHDEDDTERHFVYRKGHLRSRIRNRGECICRYHAFQDDGSFLDNLELRKCERSSEISKCSSSWHNETDEKACKSFLDPVYLGNKIYRNSYCALCNYENLEITRCEPSIVKLKRLEGATDEAILQYCIQNRLRYCTYYFASFIRGNSYSFSKLFRIREESCIPDGQFCCQGYRYDHKAKRCRRVVS